MCQTNGKIFYLLLSTFDWIFSNFLTPHDEFQPAESLNKLKMLRGDRDSCVHRMCRIARIPSTVASAGFFIVLQRCTPVKQCVQSIKLKRNGNVHSCCAQSTQSFHSRRFPLVCSTTRKNVAARVDDVT